MIHAIYLSVIAALLFWIIRKHRKKSKSDRVLRSDADTLRRIANEIYEVTR
jgi:hypothetical protein